MKNIVYIATLFLIIAGLSGCEKEIKDFDGEEGVYFYVQWGPDWFDTTYWAAQPYTKVEFDEWQTIKGGWSYADVPVTVKNSEALDEVERNLVLRLLPSEDFTLAIPQWFDLSGMLGNDSGKEEFDGTRHKIILNNFITCPKVWMGRESGKIGDLEGGLWGFFSKEKFEEILKRFPELTYEDFMSNETMPSGLKYAIQNKMAMDLQALYDKSPDHRDAIREKDGRLMWFQGVSWKSYYGVPFQPGE